MGQDPFIVDAPPSGLPNVLDTSTSASAATGSGASGNYWFYPKAQATYLSFSASDAAPTDPTATTGFPLPVATWTVVRLRKGQQFKAIAAASDKLFWVYNAPA
jgi:hypothetical protein